MNNKIERRVVCETDREKKRYSLYGGALYISIYKFKKNNNDFKKELAQFKESTLAGKIQIKL